MGNACGQNPRLSGASTCQNQNRTFCRCYGKALLGIEFFKIIGFSIGITARSHSACSQTAIAIVSFIAHRRLRRWLFRLIIKKRYIVRKIGHHHQSNGSRYFLLGQNISFYTKTIAKSLFFALCFILIDAPVGQILPVVYDWSNHRFQVRFAFDQSDKIIELVHGNEFYNIIAN